MVGLCPSISYSKIYLILGDKHDTSKIQIYELKFIPSKELDSFTNRYPILQKSILLSRKAVESNILFEKVIAKLMKFQGFPPFHGNKYSYFLQIQRIHGHYNLFDQYFLDSLND